MYQTFRTNRSSQCSWEGLRCTKWFVWIKIKIFTISLGCNKIFKRIKIDSECDMFWGYKRSCYWLSFSFKLIYWGSNALLYANKNSVSIHNCATCWGDTLCWTNILGVVRWFCSTFYLWYRTISLSTLWYSRYMLNNHSKWTEVLWRLVGDPKTTKKSYGTIRSGKLLVYFSLLCPIVSSDLHPSNSETP